MKSINLLSISGINSTNLDEKETTILRVLLVDDRLRFEEFFAATLERYKMDKKTFINRLKKLVKAGYVKHKNRIYYLVSRNRRTQYRNLNITLNKFNKEFKKFQKSKFLYEKLTLMDRIFKDLYHPLQDERLCFWSDYTKGERIKINEVITKCEKLIIKIADNAKVSFPDPDLILPPPDELISIVKVSKA